MAWKLWLRGLLAAAIGGASSGLAVIVVDPSDFNFETGAIKIAKVAIVAGLTGAALYLKEHPDPWREYPWKGGR